MVFGIKLAVKQVAQGLGSLDGREAEGYCSLAIGVEKR